MNKIVYSLLAGVVSLGLTGCGTLELETGVKSARGIMLEELQPTNKAVYIAVSGLDSNIAQLVQQKLTSRGYPVTDDLSKAKYTLRINMLDKNGNHTHPEGAAAAATVGTAAGVISGVHSGSTGTGIGTGLGVGLVTGLIAYTTADGIVRLQCDIRIDEKMSDGKLITHEDRIFADARKMRLTIEEAQPILEERIADKIAGIFIK